MHGVMVEIDQTPSPLPAQSTVVVVVVLLDVTGVTIDDR